MLSRRRETEQDKGERAASRVPVNDYVYRSATADAA